MNSRKSIPVLIAFILFAFSTGLSQNVKISRRVMTDQEFHKLKSLECIYVEGENYNVIIDGHGTGLRPPTEEQWQKIRQLPVMVDDIEFAPDGAPPNYDNSATIWFPPIGNQGGEGSCVSWACGYYTKTFQEAREHNWDLSGCLWEGDYPGYPSMEYQDKIFTPDFIYHQVNDGNDSGSTFPDNMNLMERIGCSTWDKMPYNTEDHSTWPSEDAYRQAPWYRSETGYTVMNVESDQGIDNLKELLSSGNLAVISVASEFYGDMTPEDLWTVDNYFPG